MRYRSLVLVINSVEINVIQCVIFRKSNNYISFQKQPLLLQTIQRTASTGAFTETLFRRNTSYSFMTWSPQECHFDPCCWSLDFFLLLFLLLIALRFIIILLSYYLLLKQQLVFPKIHLLLKYLLLAYQTQYHDKDRNMDVGKWRRPLQKTVCFLFHDSMWCLPPIGGRTTWHAISQEHDRCKGGLEMGHNRLTMNENQVRRVNCQELCV